MKIVTILGTRPEIIRLSLIINKLDQQSLHTLIHTGQNYTDSLNHIFFKDLELRKPDYHLNARSDSFVNQLSVIFKKTQNLLAEIKPDKVLILGDTNSGLSAIVAERMGIPVYHMEAGNRCFDNRVPEENNRKIIDSISSFALPYTDLGRENLLNEGIHKTRIFVTGNPIFEVLENYKRYIKESIIVQSLGLKTGGYFLATIHRSENVDSEVRLSTIFRGIEMIAEKYSMPVIVSVHPHTRSKLKKHRILVDSPYIKLMEPFGFFDFVSLEKNALCVLTDSGTVQEECCIFNVPTVTIRDTTERPETVRCGSNTVSGIDADKILSCTDTMLLGNCIWDYPEGYIDPNVSDKVVKLLLGS